MEEALYMTYDMNEAQYQIIRAFVQKSVGLIYDISQDVSGVALFDLLQAGILTSTPSEDKSAIVIRLSDGAMQREDVARLMAFYQSKAELETS